MLNAFFMVLPLVLTMALGWVFKKHELLTDQGVSDMNSVLYWVAVPAMLFRSTAKADPAMFEELNFIGVVYGSFLLLPFLAWGLGKALKVHRKRLAVSVMTSIRGNNVFMGLPAVTLAYGEAGVESLGVYLALSMALYQFLSIILSQVALSGNLSLESLKSTAKRLVKNPMLIACFFGFFASLYGLKIPRWADITLSIWADIGSGVALMAIGALLNLKELPSSFKVVWPDLLVRLILSPALTLLGFLLFPVDPFLAKTSVLISAMPAAVNTFVLTKGMGMDWDYAGKVVVVSTACSVLTLSFWLAVIEAMLG